jgi:hypothetical protein
LAVVAVAVVVEVEHYKINLRTTLNVMDLGPVSGLKVRALFG